MKIFFTPRVSLTYQLHSECPDDTPSIFVLSIRLLTHCSTHRSLCLEVLLQVAFSQNRELILQMMRCAACQFLHQHAHTHLWRILHMHMDLALAHYAVQDSHILAVTSLYQDVTASFINIACQNRVPVFRRPN